MLYPEKVIYVYSGKGGVGKTTVSTNLAYALSQQGKRVALFDADISGPSVPTMVHGMDGYRASELREFSVEPITVGGVLVSSAGLVCEATHDSFWAGKYLEGALYQLLYSRDWSDVDVMVIDLPPGTSDVHQQIFSNIPGKALLVVVPHELAYADTRKSFNFMARLEVETIGLVENMAYHVCMDCGRRSEIFRRSAGSLADELDVPLLASFPLQEELSEHGDRGVPFVYSSPESDVGALYTELAGNLIERYEVTSRERRVVPS